MDALAPFKENVGNCIAFANFKTVTCDGDVHAYFNAMSKTGNMQVLEALRASKNMWVDLSKRDKKARMDSMLFKTLSREGALMGSRLYALQTLYKGAPPNQDVLFFHTQLDATTEAQIMAIFRACKDNKF